MGHRNNNNNSTDTDTDTDTDSSSSACDSDRSRSRSSSYSDTESSRRYSHERRGRHERDRRHGSERRARPQRRDSRRDREREHSHDQRHRRVRRPEERVHGSTRSAFKEGHHEELDRGTATAVAVAVAVAGVAESASEISLSVDETNKLRLRLGLKPLDLAPSASEKQECANFEIIKAEKIKADRETKIRRKLEKLHARRVLATKLQGETLADASKDANDLNTWAARFSSRVLENKQAALSAKQDEQELLDQKKKDDEYTQEHLAGIAVDHDINDINVGENHVLTLKDCNVLEDKPDELESAAVRQIEYQHRVKNASKPVYSAFEDDVTGNLDDVSAKYTGPAQQGPWARLLPQYDNVDAPEESYNKVRGKTFVLGNNPVFAPNLNSKDTLPKAQVEQDLDTTLMSTGSRIAQDTLRPEEIKLKSKKKSSASRSMRRKNTEALQLLDTPFTLTKATTETEAPADSNYVDDEDLQAMLTVARRNASVKKVNLEIEKNVEDKETDEFDVMEIEKYNNKELIAVHDNMEYTEVDATLEFVNNLGQKSILGASFNSDNENDSEKATAGVKLTQGSLKRDRSDEASSCVEANDDSQKHKRRRLSTTGSKNEMDVNPLAEGENMLDDGVSGILKLLQARGEIEEIDTEKLTREEEFNKRAAWENDHKLALQKATAPGLSATARARAREQYIQQFKNYTPSFVLEYTDARGRVLSTKEAYKQLAQKVHGRSAGKNKQEKMLRREIEEMRMRSVAGGDTPLSSASAMRARQQQLGTPGIILTRGNRIAPDLATGNTNQLHHQNHQRNTRR